MRRTGVKKVLLGAVAATALAFGAMIGGVPGETLTESTGQVVSVTAYAAEVSAQGKCGEFDDQDNLGDNATYVLYNDGTLVISGEGTVEGFEVGNTIYGGSALDEWKNIVNTIVINEGITGIGERAFCGLEKLTSVTIPEGVTTIGKSAFSGCESLASVTIPDSVTSIGEEAFRDSGLTEITIPDSVESVGELAFNRCDNLVTADIHATEVCSHAFLCCSKLSTVNITSKIIGDKAFSDLEYEEQPHLTNLTLGDGVETIGAYAFEDSLITELTIPDSVSSIGEAAFRFCSLKRIVILGSKTVVGSGAFVHNVSLTDIDANCEMKCGDNLSWTLSDGVLHISGSGDMSSAPWTGTGFSKVQFDGNITSITSQAFEGCDSLTSITIPESVTSIGNGAFMDCDVLTSVAILNDKTVVEGTNDYEQYGEGYDITEVSTFQGCKKLTDIVYGGKIPCGKSTWWTLKGGVLTICGTGDMYNYDDELNPWVGIPYTKVIIDSGITSIGKYAFSNVDVNRRNDGGFFSRLTDVVISDSVTSIGGHAFEYCDKLKSITIPKNVTSIGRNAFSSCTQLTIYGYKGSEAESYASEAGLKFVALDKETITLAVPTVKATNISDGVELSWNKISNADGYIVYRKVSRDKSWTQLAKVTKNSTVTYTDKKAAAGKSYSYTVKAYKGSVYSNTQSVTIVRVAAPSKVTLSTLTNGVKVRWTKTSGAKGYIVYRKAKGAKSWTKIKTITKASTLSYTDKNAKSGKVYYYAVKAKNGNYASVVKASKAVRYLKAPAKVTVAKKSNGIKVSWKKTVGAKGYIVYRKAKGSNKWVKVKTLKNTKKLTYLDKKAKKGKTYTYRVKAYYGNSYSAVRTSKAIKRR